MEHLFLKFVNWIRRSCCFFPKKTKTAQNAKSCSLLLRHSFLKKGVYPQEKEFLHMGMLKSKFERF